MKDFIISTMETLLTFAFIVITLGGFWAGGNADPFGDFNILMALIGGVLGFCSAVLFTGVVFTLLRIKELLEEQVGILRKGEFGQRSAVVMAPVPPWQPAGGDITARQSTPAAAQSDSRGSDSPMEPPNTSSNKPHFLELAAQEQGISSDERRFLELAAQDLPLDEIALALQMPTGHVTMIRAGLRAKFHVYSEHEMVQMAREKGYLPPA